MGGAAEQECQGRNLLDALALRDTAAHRRIGEAARKAANAEAVLWRIDKAGGDPSYLFGTVHVSDDRLSELPAQATKAIQRSRVVALEGTHASESSVRAVMPLAARLMMDQSKHLGAILDEDELLVLEKAVTKAGLARELALAFRPWAAALFLAGSDCERKRQERGLKPLDLIVADAARARGLQPVGLESIVEQYESMAAIPDEVQVSWLKASIRLHDHIEDMSETTVALYLSRQIDATWSLSAEIAGKAVLSQAMAMRLRQGLVDRRNERMIVRMTPLIESGAAFIAVGATHLPGENGLVSLLKHRGWTVSPVE